MSRISANPALLYSPDALKPKKSKEGSVEADQKSVKNQITTEVEKEKKLVEKDKIEISKEAKELKEKLD